MLDIIMYFTLFCAVNEKQCIKDTSVPTHQVWHICDSKDNKGKKMTLLLGDPISQEVQQFTIKFDCTSL